jgi:hypothetical protein
MADPNDCRTCKYRESGDDAYHCYMFKEEPTTLCMKHQDRATKRQPAYTRTSNPVLAAALAALLPQNPELAKELASTRPAIQKDKDSE